MNFWKDDTPVVNKIFISEQGVISIEHSKGIFNMNSNEVREKKLLNDIWSNPINENASNQLACCFAFFMTGASQNLLSQIMVKIFGSGEIIGSLFIGNIIKHVGSWFFFIFLFILFLQFLGWFALFYRGKIAKAMVNWFLEKKQDLIVISTDVKEFKFRLRNDELIVPFLESETRVKKVSSGIKWRFYLLGSCMLLLVVTHLDIPFWFDIFLNNTKNVKLVNILELNSDQAYANYRNSDVGILRLLFDGLISNITLFIGLFLMLIILGMSLAYVVFALVLLLIQLLISLISLHYVISYPFRYLHLREKQPRKNIFIVIFGISINLLGFWAMVVLDVLNLATLLVIDKWLVQLRSHIAYSIVKFDFINKEEKNSKGGISFGIYLLIVVVGYPLFRALGISTGYTNFFWELVYVPINDLIEPLRPINFWQINDLFQANSFQSFVIIDFSLFLFAFSFIPYLIIYLIVFLYTVKYPPPASE